MLHALIDKINSIVWSPVLVVLLVFAGLYFSVRTRFVQVRRIGFMFRLLFPKREKKENETLEQRTVENMSSFKTLCLAISGCIGTGNIVGVATAIAFGGPGAVFWMWVIAFLGAATAFTESTLAQIYRFPHKEGWRGGPAAYIEKGLGARWLGIIFAILCIIGYGLFLVAVQTNGVSRAFLNSFSMSPLTTGIILAILVLIVTLGGMKRIGTVASKITPFMAVAYLIMALIIVGVNIEKVPGVLASIVKGAFGYDQALGGIIGSTIAMGVKRGLFSNEAGQGGGAIVSAIADVDHPAKQGLVQAFSVYIDTIIVCTCTALMILCTGQYNVFDMKTGEALLIKAPELGQNYVGYTQAAIDQVFSGVGGAFVAIALAFFVYTTLIAYSIYAESSIAYLCHTTGRSHGFEKGFRYIYTAAMAFMIIAGALTSTGNAWAIGDIGVGITTWINVIVLILLCPKAISALRDLEAKMKAKKASESK